MDLKQLRYFVSVAELGGFARAADLLGVTQPTLSRQIRALELDLKTSLFHRHGRGVVLTPAGGRFLRQAHGVLHAAEIALSELHDGDQRLQGRVVCGLTRSVGRQMIAAYARQFREQLPLAKLAIVNNLSTQLYDQVRASKLDFAILHNPPLSSSLAITHLGYQPLYLVGTRQIGPDPQSVELKALDKVALVMPTGPHISRHPLELEASRRGINLDITLEVDANDALFELVATGFAHTVSTQLTLRANLGSQKLVCQKIVDPSIGTNLFLVTPLARNQTPLQLAAAEIAQTTFAKIATQL
jgi:LysR family nitrogen assimilation transcriptional regulator